MVLEEEKDVAVGGVFWKRHCCCCCCWCLLESLDGRDEDGMKGADVVSADAKVAEEHLHVLFAEVRVGG